MSLKEQFEAAVADSKNLPERPDNMTLLKLYAFYKQSNIGDVSTPQAWGRHAMTLHRCGGAMQ